MSFLPPVLCLMGPTAAGKTALSLDIANDFPCEIISVDSAMVYRGLDIGTAKPEASILASIPHHLIDIRDPVRPYSAGEFIEDAWMKIHAIQAKGRIPLLVGGTMLYFRLLQDGLAALPRADYVLRQQWQLQIENEGISALHAELVKIDSEAAKRIHPQDKQRIQRALEVYRLTGQSITKWQQEENRQDSSSRLCFFAVAPETRAILHDQIALRFDRMLALKFIDEVEILYRRTDLSCDLPAIRAVGYRQAWSYLSGEINYETMREKAIAATRQLAKRQLTWLRSWPNLTWLQGSNTEMRDEISRVIK
jgi:tRNA dimethylallyltransferase